MRICLSSRRSDARIVVHRSSPILLPLQLLFDRPIEGGVPPLRLVSRFHYRRPPRDLAPLSSANVQRERCTDPRAAATRIVALGRSAQRACSREAPPQSPFSRRGRRAHLAGATRSGRRGARAAEGRQGGGGVSERRTGADGASSAKIPPPYVS